MHEVSLAEGIVSAVLKTLGHRAVPRVLSVRIAVGELAGVDCEALRFAWPSVTRGTILEDAELQIERPPGRAWCLACGQTVALTRHGDACPLCGGWRLAPTAGHELKVLDFEIPENSTT